MDTEKRFFLALLLCLLILTAYPYFLQKISPHKPIVRPSAEEETIQTVLNKGPISASRENTAQSEKCPGAKTYFLENKFYVAEFSDCEGTLTHLKIKGAEKVGAESAILIKTEPKQIGSFPFKIISGGMDLSGKLFERSAGIDPEKEIEFSYVEEGQLKITKKYSFFVERQALLLEAEWKNLSDHEQIINYELYTNFYTGEEKATSTRQVPEVNYYGEGKNEYKNIQTVSRKGFLKEGEINWIGLEKYYYTLIVKPLFKCIQARSLAYAPNTIETFLKTAPVQLASRATLQQKFLIYAGPKDYKELKSFNLHFERILYTKILGGLWLYFLLLLKFFYKIFRNYGLAVIALSIVIKVLFAPLTHMSFASMKKMQMLQPKIKTLQVQYRNDQQQLQKEIMQLYRKHKVNPLGGCLPLLLQMPIFIALYHTLTQAIELRGAKFFWWIKDLSLPDAIYTLPFSLPFLGSQVNVLPLLMIGSMVWQQQLTPSSGTSKEQERMMVLMPILFGLIFYQLPSGLVLYWLISNLLTIFHQLFIKKKAFPHPTP